MTGLVAEIEVFGVPIVRRRMLRLADRVSDASSAWEAVIRILSNATERNFASRGAYGGSVWRELKPATRARKARLGLDPRILRATGRLYDSLVLETHAEHINEVGPHEMRWGSTVPYGVYHQSTAPRTKIPYRPPVKLPEQDKRAIVREIQRSIVGGE
jgi:phage gpG-like protein